MPRLPSSRHPFEVPSDPMNIQYWEQDGRAIQDTEPPDVLLHDVTVEGGQVFASILAEDLTTTPVAANLYYSVDGGINWFVLALDPIIDPIEGPTQNEFVGSGPLGAAGTNMEYFFNIQDGVMNNTWFGPGVLALPPRHVPSTSPWGMTILVVLVSMIGGAYLIRQRRSISR